MAKKLPKFLWAEAVNIAVFVLNRSGPMNFDGKTPYEVFTQKMTAVQRFQVFGANCFVQILKEKRKKWDAKEKEGVLVWLFQ